MGAPVSRIATKGCNIRKNCSLVLIVITSNVKDVLKLQQATGSLGRHLPEKIPDRSAGGGAEKVPTMFLKSKQSIIREKLDLKPQKGSLSLRQDLKSKTSKNSKSAQSESKATKNQPL